MKGHSIQNYRQRYNWDLWLSQPCGQDLCSTVMWCCVTIRLVH